MFGEAPEPAQRRFTVLRISERTRCDPDDPSPGAGILAPTAYALKEELENAIPADATASSGNATMSRRSSAVSAAFPPSGDMATPQMLSG